MTNCNNGEFHEWVYKNKKLKCIKCNKTFESLQKEQNQSTVSEENLEDIFFKQKLLNN